MKIKNIENKDLKSIEKEYLHYFNEYEDSEWDIPRVQRKFKQLTDRYDYCGLGLYENDKLIGFAIGVLSQFDDGIIAILNELFIIHEMQSKGYGSKLLKAFEEETKRRGAFRIQLESANDEIHHRFYNEMNEYQDTNNNIIKAKGL